MSVLVVSPTLPSINTREPRNDDIHIHRRRVLLRRLSRAPLLLLLRGPGDDAHDFGVAHLKVRRAIGGILGSDLGVEAAQFVPATAVDAQER